MGHLVSELYIEIYDYYSTLIIAQLNFILLLNSFLLLNHAV